MRASNSRIPQHLIGAFRYKILAELSVAKTEGEVQTRLTHAVLMVDVAAKKSCVDLGKVMKTCGFGSRG
jgi:hypothetical protein